MLDQQSPIFRADNRSQTDSEKAQKWRREKVSFPLPEIWDIGYSVDN